jgi:hypothetical protein
MFLLNGLRIWVSEETVSLVLSKSSAWGGARKAIVRAFVSAVRRLLPPPAEVSQKPVMLGPMQWVDVAGRALRRAWMAHWRSQYVEVIVLTTISEKISPPPRPPRAVRSHHRFRWHDRLACNAWWGPPQQRVTVAGVPAFLAIK